MKIRSTIYKIQNTPKEVLKKKLSKKLFKENSSVKSEIYFEVNDISLKSGLFRIDKDFFQNYKIQFEDIVNNILQNKMKIFSDKFILVSDSSNIGYKNINWQKDFLSGFEWDINTPSKEIKFGIGESEQDENLRKYIGAEIKFPWELGRQQDLVPLSIYYNLCEDAEKSELIEFYKNRIYDFSSNNPIGFGTQWQTSMDVSIRAVNYLISYDILIQGGANFEKSFEEHFCDLIQEHFYYIYNNLEFNDGLRGNHYLANLMGLIIIYSYFDLSNVNEQNNLNQIIEFAISSFFEELLYQFNSDGGNFEASIPYHFFATEMVLITLFFIERFNDVEFDVIKIQDNKIHYRNDITNRILNIIQFSKNFMIEDHIPNIGDNDSGFVLDLMPFVSQKYSLYLLLNKFDKSELNIEFKEEKGIIGELLFKINTYFLAQDFGISRSSNRTFDLVTFAGYKGQKGKGGHSHNDKCSFELYFKGNPLLVDLGSAFYTSNWKKRNYYRSVKQHNLLHINYEQDLIHEEERDDLFWLYGNKSKSSIVYANDEKIKCKHYAYGKEYVRELFLDEKSLIGKEYFERKFEKNVAFHFHPDCEVTLNNNRVFINSKSSKFELKSEGNILDIEDAIYSPEYGIERKCKRVIIKSKDFEINWELNLIED